MAPQFVKPYVKTNKNDASDAEAICEAVGRPNMRFVPVKNVEQQAVLARHRVNFGQRHRLQPAQSAQLEVGIAQPVSELFIYDIDHSA